MTQLMDMPTTTTNGNGHAPAKVKAQTVMGSLAERYSMDPAKLLQVMKATCIKGSATDEQVQAFCIVANRYGLDPFLKEIHAFAGQGGGIVPIVGIDGWTKIANSTGALDGCEFEFQGEGNDLACTCVMYVKGRSRPTRVTEYMAECGRGTQPWKQWPRRMLRHKAFMQCARVAFGLGGIYDEDEAQEIIAGEPVPAVTVSNAPPVSRAAALAAKVAPTRELPAPIPSEEEANRIIEQKAQQARETAAAREGESTPLPDTLPPQTQANEQGDEGANTPSEDLTDYATFYGLCESEVAGTVEPEQFTKAMAALAVSTAIKSPRRGQNLPARQQVLRAIREGKVDWANGKIA